MSISPSVSSSVYPSGSRSQGCVLQHSLRQAQHNAQQQEVLHAIAGLIRSPMHVDSRTSGGCVPHSAAFRTVLGSSGEIDSVLAGTQNTSLHVHGLVTNAVRHDTQSTGLYSFPRGLTAAQRFRLAAESALPSAPEAPHHGKFVAEQNSNSECRLKARGTASGNKKDAKNTKKEGETTPTWLQYECGNQLVEEGKQGQLIHPVQSLWALMEMNCDIERTLELLHE